MKFTVRHTFECSLDDYWSKIFFDPEYNRRLYEEVLKFKSYQLLEQKDLGGGAITRTARLEPNFDAPGPVKRVLGDRFYYTERGELDPKARRWRYKITPSVIADRANIGGDFWAESRGDKRIERICELVIEVKIFGVGAILEGFVEKQTRESYDHAAAFTNRYIREKGL